MPNVIVTGGSRGLGLGIVRKLAATGFVVIAVARGESEQLASAMRDPGSNGRAHFRSFDLNEVSAIPELVKNLRAEFGPIYGLVNNAALGTNGILATMRDPHIDRLMQLNVVSPITLTKYVVRAMMVDGGGRIVNIASIVGSTGYSGLSVYSASKAAIVGFTRSLAREVGPLGINVNAVAPGFVDTEFARGIAGEHRDQIVRRSALRRLAEVEDVANVVEFLLSDGAKGITGTVVTVDTGATA